MSDHVVNATDAQREQAILHATVFEAVFAILRENAERRSGIDKNLFYSLARAALIVSGEYRRVASSGRVEP